MKKLTFLAALIFIGLSTSATTKSVPVTTSYYGYDSSIIFVENNVEFSIYPDGQFDFYYQPTNNFNFNINTPEVNISYNNGYNYNPYLQYDDFGAVVQIENIPIFYDYYGRIIQAGNVQINYNRSGRLTRVGGLFVYYNNYGQFQRFRGYINPYNRNYVYRAWHHYYSRPILAHCIIYQQPYRAHYVPRRISYADFRSNYSTNYYNRSNFYRPSERVNNYSRGTRTETRRNIANVNTRTNSSVANTSNNTRTQNNVSTRNNSSTNNSTRNAQEINTRNNRQLSTIDRVPTNNSSTKTASNNRALSRESSVRSVNNQNNTVFRKPNTVNSRTFNRYNENNSRTSGNTRSNR